MLTSLGEDLLLLGLDLKSKDLGRHSSSRKVTDEEVEVGNTTLSGDTSDLALLVETPDWVEASRPVISDSRTDSVWESSVSSSEDYGTMYM